MASLSTLPTEILENIISKIPQRPFHTELLLLNKILCHIFMTEQVRSLKLQEKQFDSWISVISNSDIKMPYPELRYCNLLSQVVELDIITHRGDIKEAIVRFIGDCVNLRILSIKAPEYGDHIKWDTGLIFNSLNSNVIKISLTRFLTDKEGIRSLVSYMKQNKKLEVLYLSGENDFLWSSNGNVGDNGVIALADFLKQYSTLTQLNLRYYNIGNNGAIALAESLKQNSTLTQLNLEYNMIGENGIIALAESLKQNSTLTQLNLRGNEIGKNGAIALAESLKQNYALTQLNLGFNKIRNDGAIALAKSLKQNYALTQLDLGFNEIRNDGAIALAEFLKQNSTLTRLYFFHNEIGNNEAIALAKSLKQNSSLIELNLRQNVIVE